MPELDQRGPWIAGGDEVERAGSQREVGEERADRAPTRRNIRLPLVVERLVQVPDVAREPAQALAYSVAPHRLEGASQRPIIEQARKIDATAHRQRQRPRWPRVDLHQYGPACAVATELDHRAA